MLTLMLIHAVTRFARFSLAVGETLRETQRLRRSLAGPIEE